MFAQRTLQIVIEPDESLIKLSTALLRYATAYRRSLGTRANLLKLWICTAWFIMISKEPYLVSLLAQASGLLPVRMLLPEKWT